MSGGYRADPATLSTVAGKLRGSSSELEGAKAAPDGVEAGAPSALIAAVVAHLAEQSNTLVAGLEATGNAVESSSSEYEAQELWVKEYMPKPGAGGNRPV